MNKNNKSLDLMQEKMVHSKNKKDRDCHRVPFNEKYMWRPELTGPFYDGLSFEVRLKCFHIIASLCLSAQAEEVLLPLIDKPLTDMDYNLV